MTASFNMGAYLCTEDGGRRGCWDLNKGSKLRVLSYTYIHGILFALVYVESC